MASFSNRLRQIILLSILIALGFLLVKELYVFLPGFLGALTLYILSRKSYYHLTNTKKWRKGLTATLFLLAFLVIVGFPLYYIISLLSPKISAIFNHSDEVVLGLKSVSAQISSWTGQELFTDSNMVEFQKKIANFFPAFLNSTAMIVSNLFMMLFVYFFMLTNGKEMEDSLHYFLPLHEKNIEILGNETISVVRANAIGIPLISIIQGFFAIIGYWIFGINEFVLWGFITGIFAFFPIVGTTLIWAPLVVYLFSQGHSGQGIGLMIYSLMVTGNVDYLARITLMKRMGDVHPLITVLGVIVGLSLFGFWGFIFGPLLISYFILLFKIYSSEFGPIRAEDNPHQHGS